MSESNSGAAAIECAALVISALDSEQRLQIILKLAERDHVVHELVAALGKSQPLISQHLRVLKRVGLVTSTRAGREVAYHLAVREAADIIDLANRVGVSAQAGTVDELDARRSSPSHQVDNSDSEQVSAVTDESATGGKAAIAGRASDESLDMPGLIPELPTPPIPRIL